MTSLFLEVVTLNSNLGENFTHEDLLGDVREYVHGQNIGTERAAFQRSAFWQSTAGNDVVATIFIHLFFLFFPVFSHRRSARIKKLI